MATASRARFVFYLLSGAAVSAIAVAAPKATQPPDRLHLAAGERVLVKPSAGEGYTRLRFIAERPYFPSVTRNADIVTVTLDGGGKFAPLDIGAADSRINGISAAPDGRKLRILLNKDDVGTRIYFSEHAGGVDIIDCPCPDGPLPDHLAAAARTSPSESPPAPERKPDPEAASIPDPAEVIPDLSVYPEPLDADALIAAIELYNEEAGIRRDLEDGNIAVPDSESDKNDMMRALNGIVAAAERRLLTGAPDTVYARDTEDGGIFIYERTADSESPLGIALDAEAPPPPAAPPEPLLVIDKDTPEPPEITAAPAQTPVPAETADANGERAISPEELTAVSNGIAALYKASSAAGKTENAGAATEQTPVPAPTQADDGKPEEESAQTASPAPAAGRDTADNTDKHVAIKWKRRPSAAFFTRHGITWMIFAAEDPVNADDVIAEARERLFASFDRIEHPVYTIYYGKPKDGVKAVALNSGRSGAFYRTDIVAAEETPQTVTAVPVTTETGKLVGSHVRLEDMPLIAPLRLYDPFIGDELLVMTAYENGRGVAEARVFPDFRIMPSFQGAAAELRSDRVIYEYDGSDIAIIGPTNRLAASAQSALSELREQERLEMLQRRSGDGEEDELSLLKYGSWRKGGNDRFTEERAALLESITAAAGQARSEARAALARFYMAHGMEPEALGVLGVLKERDPVAGLKPELRFLEGVARYLIQDYAGASEIFNAIEPLAFADPEHRDELGLWRAMADLRAYNAGKLPEKFFLTGYVQDFGAGAKVNDDDNNSGKNNTDKADNTTTPDFITAMRRNSPDAGAAPPPVPDPAPYADAFMSYYPHDIYNDLLLDIIEANLRRNAAVEAETVFAMLKRDDTRPSFINKANILRGIAVAKDGKEADALLYWKEAAEDTSDPPRKAEAEFLTAYLSYKENMITQEEAIKAFNTVRTNWRGGVIELNALKMLGDLYIQQEDYMRGFEAWRVAATNFKGNEAALDIAARLSEKFALLLGRKDQGSLSQLEMLTLFYEFRDLVPVGAAGDTIISRLADRLISVDLLSRASALLTHQVKYRLKGDARDEAIFKLVDIHMRNKRFEEALEVLKSIEAEGENSEEIKKRVRYLNATALIELGKYNGALKSLRGDESPQAGYLRTEIYWRNRIWRHVINELAPIFREIRREKNAFTAQETDNVIRLAVAYALKDRRKYLGTLREDFEDFITDEKKKELFRFITLDRGKVNPMKLDYSLEFAEIKDFMEYYYQEKNNNSFR